MEGGDERTQFLEKGDADGFEVRFAGIGRAIDVFTRRPHFGDVAVEPYGAGLGGNLPLRRAKENADVFRAESGDPRRNGFSLKGLIDSAENKGIASGEDDHTATSEVCDDFVFLSPTRSRRP